MNKRQRDLVATMFKQQPSVARQIESENTPAARVFPLVNLLPFRRAKLSFFVTHDRERGCWTNGITLERFESAEAAIHSCHSTLQIIPGAGYDQQLPELRRKFKELTDA